MSLDVDLIYEGCMVFEYNITHNLGAMAAAVDAYAAVWRPETVNITHAKHLIVPLKAALESLRENPARFDQYVPSNGWGKHDSLVKFFEQYLAACEEYPEASIRVST